MTIISIPQAARRPAAIVAATIAAGLLAARTIAADATVSGPNRRPICNNTSFNMPRRR